MTRNRFGFYPGVTRVGQYARESLRLRQLR